MDAKTGQRHWSFDMLAAAWGSPLIVEDRVYVGDEDGDVSIFPLTADPAVALKKNEKGKPIPAINMIEMGNAVYSTPVVANNVLYISNKDHLFAIQAP
jgi:outer membrane protein assembly factor BamB